VNGAGQIEIEVEGLWAETILYEVPLMAILSESYFKTVDVDWNMEGQEGEPSGIFGLIFGAISTDTVHSELAYQKGKTLLQTGAAFSEFGTRRRRSYAAHETVLRGLIRARDEFEGKCSVLGKLTGTSNVRHLQPKYTRRRLSRIAGPFCTSIRIDSRWDYRAVCLSSDKAHYYLN
jgi:nicotinate phosphoribosyltransferase